MESNQPRSALEALRSASPWQKAVLSGLLMALSLPVETYLRAEGLRSIGHLAISMSGTFYSLTSAALHWVFVLAVLAFLMLQLVVDRSLRLSFLLWMLIAAVAEVVLVLVALGPLSLFLHGAILGCCIAAGIDHRNQCVRFGIWTGTIFMCESLLTSLFVNAGVTIILMTQAGRPTGDIWNPSFLHAFVFGAAPIFMAAQLLSRRSRGVTLAVSSA